MTERLIKKQPEEISEIPGGNYALNRLTTTVNETVSALTGKSTNLTIREVPTGKGGDYAIQVATVAKELGQSPVDLASSLVQKFPKISLFREIKTQGAYVNFEVNMAAYGSIVVDQILKMGADYGKENIGNGDVVVIDMSSPNVAKRMHVAHLRSTIIGKALSNIYKSLGFEVIRDNHIGDWGTQFGKIIAGVDKWSSETELLNSSDPVGLLQDIYVKYEAAIWDEKANIFIKGIYAGNEQYIDMLKGLFEKPEQFKAFSSKLDLSSLKKFLGMEKDMEDEKSLEQSGKKGELEKIKKYIGKSFSSDLEEKGKAYFSKLEKGDPRLRKIWKHCVELSLKEFQHIYDDLDVEFELVRGESYYEDKLPEAIQEIKDSPLSRVSDGALIIDYSGEKIGLEVEVFQKDDGASVYYTRDYATVKNRLEEFGAKKIIYVVGADQVGYFKHLFETITRMGYGKKDDFVHVYFGMVTLPEGKISTREGRTILLKDLLDKGLEYAAKFLDQLQNEKSDLMNKRLSEASPEEKARLNVIAQKEKERILFIERNKEKILKQIAYGSLIWNDLSQDPRRSIVFKWEDALKMTGNSAPFVQYAAVRAESIEKASGIEERALLEIDPAQELKEETYQEASERELIRALAAYPEAIRDAYTANDPSKVAVYAYELAKKFNNLYAKVHILTSDDPNIKISRLRLVAATRQVISNALNLLGIEVPAAM